MTGLITPNGHFTWDELACHDAERTPVPAEYEDHARAVVAELERIRHYCGNLPLTVTRLYSTPEHNATIPGAASQSFHLQALAADIISPDGLSALGLFEVAVAVAILPDSLIRFVRLYRHDGHVHLDLRTTPQYTFEVIP